MVDKVRKVMREFKSGALHSGSKTGPRVTNPKQAIAIGLSEQAKADHKPRARSVSHRGKRYHFK